MKQVVMVAAIAAIVVYVLGVGTGLIASNMFKEQAELRISDVENQSRAFDRSSAEQIESLESYVRYLQDSVSTLQIEEAFSESLTDEQQCTLADSVSEVLADQLQTYREELPYRLEAYPEGGLSNEHAVLKDQYDSLSIRVWILLRRQAQRCETTPEPILYLYSRDCEACVQQGEALDMIDRTRGNVLAVDLHSDDPLVKLVARYYNITHTPTLVIGEEVYTGFTPIDVVEGEIA